MLFLGHGNPMNAIEENEFVEGIRRIRAEIPQPASIVCISAHWETRGTQVTSMKKPRTIHDFGGFPEELYRVQYPAPGNPELASETAKMISTETVGLDENWGLDHGAWSVIKHLYPQADVPVIQLSLNYLMPARRHFELAGELSALREKGILIIGSGNIVHNLRLVDWNRMNESGYGFEWAEEASNRVRELIHNRDFDPLVEYRKLGRAFDLAVPTPEHYLPLLYILALTGKHDSITLFNDKPVGGSLTMTSLLAGS